MAAPLNFRFTIDEVWALFDPVAQAPLARGRPPVIAFFRFAFGQINAPEFPAAGGDYR
jgi:hypothetical protein